MPFLAQTLLLAAMALGAIAQDSSASASTTDSAVSSSATSATMTSSSTSGSSASFTAPTPSITMFFPGIYQEGMAVSVVSADACTRVLAVGCGSTSARGCTILGGSAYTYTSGPNFFEFATQTQSGGLSASGRITCSLGGTTVAACGGTLAGSSGGQATTTTAAPYTFSGAALSSLYETFPVTGNANALSVTTGSCTVSHNTAAPSSSQGAAPKAIIKTIYKVAVVPAAAAVFAGVMAA